jgi:hypothetical protein
MSKIHLPPSRHDDLEITACVRSDGIDTLDIYIVHPGYFVHTPKGLFDPDLPSGYQAALPPPPPPPPPSFVLKPTVSTGTVYLGYFDSKTNTPYLVVITIQPGQCPPGSDVSEE